MDDVRAGFRKQVNILIPEVGHVHTLGFGAEQAQPVESVQWAFAVLLEGL